MPCVRHFLGPECRTGPVQGWHHQCPCGPLVIRLFCGFSCWKKIMMPGGLSDEQPPSDKVEQLLHSIKDKVEEKLGREVPQFKLVSYKTQVVAGKNYFAKVDIGEDEVVHMRVYQDLKQNLSLHSIQHPKGREDDIAYF